MSTVSGGGYLGSFLSSYLDSDRTDVGADGQRQLPFHKPPVGETAALRHLRAHSKFLLTGGITGRLVMALQAAYGLLGTRKRGTRKRGTRKRTRKRDRFNTVRHDIC